MTVLQILYIHYKTPECTDGVEQSPSRFFARDGTSCTVLSICDRHLYVCKVIRNTGILIIRIVFLKRLQKRQINNEEGEKSTRLSKII